MSEYEILADSEIGEFPLVGWIGRDWINSIAETFARPGEDPTIATHIHFYMEIEEARLRWNEVRRFVPDTVRSASFKAPVIDKFTMKRIHRDLTEGATQIAHNVWDAGEGFRNKRQWAYDLPEGTMVKITDPEYDERTPAEEHMGVIHGRIDESLTAHCIIHEDCFMFWEPFKDGNVTEVVDNHLTVVEEED